MKWIESRSLLNTNPSVQNHLLNRGGESKQKVKKDILGWEVWFLSNLNNQKWLNDVVKHDEKIVERILAGLKSLGIRKNIRVPILVHYYKSETGEEGVAFPSTFLRSKGNTYKDSPSIHVFFSGSVSEESFAKTLIHEIGHQLYSYFNEEQKETIKRIAYKSKPASEYGRISDQSPYHKTGEEWFCEMLAIILYGIDAGYTGQVYDKSKFINALRYLFTGREARNINNTKDAYDTWGKDLSILKQNLVLSNPQSNNQVKVPKRLRNSVPTDSTGRYAGFREWLIENKQEYLYCYIVPEPDQIRSLIYGIAQTRNVYKTPAPGMRSYQIMIQMPREEVLKNNELVERNEVFVSQNVINVPRSSIVNIPEEVVGFDVYVSLELLKQLSDRYQIANPEILSMLGSYYKDKTWQQLYKQALDGDEVSRQIIKDYEQDFGN